MYSCMMLLRCSLLFFFFLLFFLPQTLHHQHQGALEAARALGAELFPFSELLLPWLATDLATPFCPNEVGNDQVLSPPLSFIKSASRLKWAQLQKPHRPCNRKNGFSVVPNDDVKHGDSFKAMQQFAVECWQVSCLGLLQRHPASFLD